MGEVVQLHFHAAASALEVGRGTSDGQGASGQWTENHVIASSRRRVWISAPHSIAASFLPSLSARVDTVDSASPSICEYARATVRRCSIPVMTEISVILPRMSTAILPKAKIVPFGYPTSMGRDELLQWIKDRLLATKLSESKASKMAGHRDALRNFRLGKANPKIETWKALAKVLKAPFPGLDEDDIAPTGAKLPTLEKLRERLAEAEDRLVETEKNVNDLKTTISTLERLQEKTG